jgi:alpha-N-arabinofuranosidase
VHPNGIVKRTTFHVLEMYAGLLEPNVLPAQVSADPLRSGEKQVAALDAAVTASDDRGRFAIALVNRHADRPIDCKLNLSAAPRGGTVQVRVLAGDSPDAFNDVDRPDRVAPETYERKLQGGVLQLPAHSISIVRASV